MRFYAVAILIAVLAPVFATVHMVSITDFLFTPRDLDIAVGDTVHWTNNGATLHTVDNPFYFHSGPLSQGGSFHHNFTFDGNLPYYGTNHRSMRGTIHVT
ncbi:plastocyanin [Dissophora ornata]|nr:plastocyanin [Dissophora ornata]